tara:strand:+ start:432 stop:854 length:423 start_codon:yes stop_codon:yes gene_type:complete
MKLKSRARYAVMALADIAKENSSKAVPLRDISLRQGISINYLEQLFFHLKKNNLVISSRGKAGGYFLSKDPSEIKLLNIVKAVNDEVKTTRCNKKSKNGCTGKTMKCITHNLWDELENHINIFFNSKSLKSILELEKKTK